jgi:hypothetical protein
MLFDENGCHVCCCSTLSLQIISWLMKMAPFILLFNAIAANM